MKKYPPKYIYEPWTAPLSVQRAAECVIGKDYPRPIVDHKEAVKTNIARMKRARAEHYGGDGADEGDLFELSNQALFLCLYVNWVTDYKQLNLSCLEYFYPKL